MAFIDWVIIAAYFVLVFGIALWAYRQEQGDDTAAGYFLGGRNVGWFVVGSSLFVSNIGSEHLVGLSGTGAASGVAVGQFEVLASLVLLLLGWVFVPFYVKSGVFTMPEFLERRYSRGARTYLTWISIISYVLTKISVTLFAGGIVFETLMGINFWTGAIITVVFTGAYTVFGGLRAVVYTDMLQMFVLIAGAVLVTVMGLVELGGPAELVETVPEGFMSVWQPISDPAFPWTGILFGAPILGIWYWCTDQVIVQRTLAARDLDHARRGSIFAGYLKALPLFIFVIPGVVAYALSQTGRLTLGSPDEALPALVASVLPVGLRGLVAAGLIAALMSSLSSVFNSTSTLITWDIYRERRPTASDRELVWVGRVATALLTLAGLAWLPFIENISSTLYTYLQSVQSYIAPPIAAVFILGLAWRRINAAGALTTLLAGFVIGAARLILELVHGPEQEGLAAGSVLAAFAEFNFLHFAAVLFVVCVIILVGVSMATSPPPDYKVAGLTYGTAEEDLIAPPMSAGDEARAAQAQEEAGTTMTEEREERESPMELTDRPGWRRLDLLLTIGVFVLVGLVWLFFSPLFF